MLYLKKCQRLMLTPYRLYMQNGQIYKSLLQWKGSASKGRCTLPQYIVYSAPITNPVSGIPEGGAGDNLVADAHKCLEMK